MAAWIIRLELLKLRDEFSFSALTPAAASQRGHIDSGQSESCISVCCSRSAGVVRGIGPASSFGLQTANRVSRISRSTRSPGQLPRP